MRGIRVYADTSVFGGALDEEFREPSRGFFDLVKAGILGESSYGDALHVAAATVANVDLILSWNFRHIVNYDRIRRYNAVNALNGHRSIEIRSPSEIVYGDTDKDL